ncbi:MAG TPA: MBL fold metallo-hydrolase [bacterium]|nr:MBL fold metallo-hydrolase [bacterium]
MATNCYFLVCEPDNIGVVIDPGGDAEHILEAVERAGVERAVILNTHGHGDHIEANEEISLSLDAPIYIGAGDAPALTDPAVNLSVFLGTPIVSPAATRLLKDGDILRFGSETLEVMETPGHSPGSVCFYIRRLGWLFCGDLVFLESVGRTDLPGGDFPILLQSIAERVLTLPEETVLYPGHGPQTTVGHEVKHNSFLGDLSRFHM